MTKLEASQAPEKPTIPAADGLATAPELPKAVAHQFGITIHRPSAKAAPEAAVPADAKEDQVFEDEKTVAAVDDILAKESDTLLKVDDAKNFTPTVPSPKKPGFWRRHKWLRWVLFLLILAIIGAAAAVPQARYRILNQAGVRSSASVTVLDQTTQLPLKKVAVSIDGQQVQTDVQGIAKLKDLKLGEHTLTVKRIAFAPVSRQITIGWGSNPLGSYSLTATGTQYTVQVTDYVSGKPVSGVDASNNELNALSDKDGKIVLTIGDTDITEVKLTVSASGYRPEPLALKAAEDNTVIQVKLVPVRKEVFVTKQSGKYDLYSMDIDGQNKKLLLAGTGREGSNIALVTNDSGDHAALVSSRDDKHDEDGYLLTTLALVDLTSDKVTVVEHAAQIQPIDWIGSRLIYRVAMPGASAADSQRYRLISYDYESSKRTQIAATNQFNAVVSAGGWLYFAPSSTDPTAQLGWFKIRPDGTSKTQLFQQEVWSALRTAYNTVMLQTPNSWYNYELGTIQPTKSDAPTDFSNNAYVDNSDGTLSAWIDERDGKGTLLVRDIKAGTDSIVHSQEGLAYPVRWLNNDTLLYRAAKGGETADYVKSLTGGEAHKVVDVTNTYGFAQAF